MRDHCSAPSAASATKPARRATWRGSSAGAGGGGAPAAAAGPAGGGTARGRGAGGGGAIALMRGLAAAGLGARDARVRGPLSS